MVRSQGTSRGKEVHFFVYAEEIQFKFYKT